MADHASRFQMLTVDGRSVGIHVLDAAPRPAPSGPPALPIILLHGLGCSSDAWRPALDTLALRRAECPVYVPDLPGFGCSAGPKAALSVPELADWITRLMDGLGLERAHLAGNSLGGQVALSLACRHPERVGRLVLVGSTIGGDYISLWRYASGLLLDGVQEPLGYSLVLARMYSQMGLVRYLETTRWMLKDEPLLYASAVAAPCLVLRGTRDGIIPDGVARRLAAALPNSRFRRLSGTAHAMQFTRPREFTEIALSFWAGHGEDGSGE